MAVALPDFVSWTQDEESVEISVSVSIEAVRADLHVATTAETIRVQSRNSAGEPWRPLLMGSLAHAVDASSCCWSLEKKRSSKAVVIQLEKAVAANWDVLLKADASGSILEELGRDQVIADAGEDTESSVCGRCGALVKASRMEAHATMWCEALQADTDDGSGLSSGLACPEPPVKSPASHLFWSTAPTAPTGTAAPKRIGDSEEVLV